MKNIIVLTRRYYPNMSPISAVIDKYIQRLKFKYNFHVICIAGQSSLVKPDDPIINVHYIKNKLWIVRLWSEEKYNETGKKLYYYIMQMCRARAAFLNLLGDNLAYKWEKNAYYKALVSISRNTTIDGIISVSGDTVFTHLAAQKFKIEDPSTIWLSFFTDPYTFQDMMFYPALFDKEKNKRKRYITEKNIYDAADNNIVTEELYKSVIEDFKQPKNKTICFKYVLDDIRAKIGVIEKPSTCGESISLMYAGAFYRKIRNPRPVLAIMDKVNNIIFDLYVTSRECNDILDKYKSDSIKVYDGVPASEYKHKICYEYDILVNVGNDCDFQAPSKMLEYVSTGRPIINFYYRKDSQYELISHYPLGLNVDIRDVEAYKEIESFCKDMKGKQMPFKDIEELFPDNNLSKQVNVLETLIENKYNRY